MADAKPKNLSSKEDFVSQLDQKLAVCTPLQNLVGACLIISGASSHITSNRLSYPTFNRIKLFFVQVDDNSRAEVRGRDNIELQVRIDKGLKTCVLKDVLFVPSLIYFLISVDTMCKNGFKVSFSDNQVVISDKDKSVAQASNVAPCTCSTWPCRNVHFKRVPNLGKLVSAMLRRNEIFKRS